MSISRHIYFNFVVNLLSGWIFWWNLLEMIYILRRSSLPNFIKKINWKMSQKAQSVWNGAHGWWAPDPHPIYKPIYKWQVSSSNFPLLSLFSLSRTAGAGKSLEEQHPVKTFGWSAKGTSDVLSPFKFSRSYICLQSSFWSSFVSFHFFPNRFVFGP